MVPSTLGFRVLALLKKLGSAQTKIEILPFLT
jgi:hypothetical protein